MKIALLFFFASISLFVYSYAGPSCTTIKTPCDNPTPGTACGFNPTGAIHGQNFTITSPPCSNISTTFGRPMTNCLPMVSDTNAFTGQWKIVWKSLRNNQTECQFMYDDKGTGQASAGWVLSAQTCCFL
jgi:hypothetical protein